MFLSATRPSQGASHSAEEKAVLATVQRLFDSLASKDIATLRAQMLPDDAATLYRQGRFITMTLSGVGDREEKLTSGPDHLEERIVHPMVRIDNNIAMVWGAYEATRNGKPDHCGTDIFTLVNRDSRWLIASITDTSRPCVSK
jgi:Putative lumazine-binding